MVNVIIRVYIEQVQELNLEALRADFYRKFCQEYDLSSDDFYNDGPFKVLPAEDYELAGIASAPGLLLDANFCLAYYGVGYERGELPLYKQTAEWLEERYPGCAVSYGNDSNGETRPWPAVEREKILRYYKLFGSEPYYRKDLTWDQKNELYWSKYEDQVG